MGDVSGRSARVVRAVPSPAKSSIKAAPVISARATSPLIWPFSKMSKRSQRSVEEFEILLDDQNGQALLLAESRENPADLLDDRRLNAFGRLVEQQHMRLGNETARERQDLLLAA